MLPGFNHNIKHNGRIYHVQTEDSGVSNPHIITHLFVGGNILATKKTSYADIVHADNLTVVVQELMEEQHKAMLRNLVNSVYNGMEVPGKPAEPTAQAPQPAEPKPVWGKSSPPTIPPRTQPSIPAHAAPTQPEMPAVREAQIYKPAPPDKVLKAPKPAKPTPRVSIRPAKPVHPASAPQQEPRPEPRVTVRPTKPALPAPAPQAVKPAPPVSKPSKDLPPEVVAARRLAERPRPKDTTGPTIFGEDLISDKSLDEVILGYLAGDGEEGS
jgi:hypothetical protein